MWTLEDFENCCLVVVLTTSMVTVGVDSDVLEESSNCYQHDEARMPQLTVQEYRVWEGILRLNPRSAKNFLNQDAPDACRISCLQKNAKYFGLRKYGSLASRYTRCYCGNELPGPLVDQTPYCNYWICGGYPCGGGVGNTGYSNVYEVFSSVGCTIVNQNKVRSQYPAIYQAGVCRETCMAEGTALYGLQQQESSSSLCLCLADFNINIANLGPSELCSEVCERVSCTGELGFTNIYTICPLGTYPDRERENLCSSHCDCPSGLCNLNGTCIQCPAGFSGQLCQEDINECDDVMSRRCGGQDHCENSIGSYHCVCNLGHESGPGNKSCVDINECEKNAGICGQKATGRCVNTVGSYYCVCKQGYTSGTGNQTCVDFDECSSNSSLCGPDVCYNIPGEYRCCTKGYTVPHGHSECTGFILTQGHVWLGPVAGFILLVGCLIGGLVTWMYRNGQNRSPSTEPVLTFTKKEPVEEYEGESDSLMGMKVTVDHSCQLTTQFDSKNAGFFGGDVRTVGATEDSV